MRTKYIKCDGQGPGDKRISTQTKILYLRKEERERQKRKNKN